MILSANKNLDLTTSALLMKAPGITPMPNPSSQRKLRPRLDFKFNGYTIWLEIDGGKDGDYFHCIQECASTFGVEPIEGHVTAVYGEYEKGIFVVDTGLNYLITHNGTTCH